MTKRTRGKQSSAKVDPLTARYRVVFGENIPSWERHFNTWRDAAKFIHRHLALGDLIFSVEDLRMPSSSASWARAYLSSLTRAAA